MTDIKDLTKRNGLYFLPDPQDPKKEHTLISVTTILGDMVAKPGLMYWAARTAARFWEISDDAHDLSIK